jgi:hypothetical protein
MEIIKGDWACHYVGKCDKILLDSMTNALKSDQGGYSAIGTIIQSSGYGKSRMVDQVARQVFTLPFNLRDPAEDDAGGTSLWLLYVKLNYSCSIGLAFPPSDIAVRNYFLPDNQKNGFIRVDVLFFISLFTTVIQTLDEPSFNKLSGSEFVQPWKEYLDADSNRASLYGKAIRLVCYSLSVFT